MAAVCIWYKEEQKGNKTGMNQDRVYEIEEFLSGKSDGAAGAVFAAQPYGEEVWRSSRKRGNGSGCSRIIPGRHLICSGWWRQSVTAWITAAA